MGRPINLWLIPGIAAMEYVLFFFPLSEGHSFHEKSRKAPASPKCSKYSSSALERALRHDIRRLERFAATTDLTAENILFLKQVDRWKARWHVAESNGAPIERDIAAKRELYDEAERIWNTLVSRRTAQFPINIDDDVYEDLNKAFSTASPISPFRAHIAPFADFGCPSKTTMPEDMPRLKLKKILRLDTANLKSPRQKERSIRSPSWCYGSQLFDRAEAAVRQLVLENTWIRYVDSLPEKEKKRVKLGEAMKPSTEWRRRSMFWRKETVETSSKTVDAPV
jgi:hypothetical protein